MQLGIKIELGEETIINSIREFSVSFQGGRTDKKMCVNHKDIPSHVFDEILWLYQNEAECTSHLLRWPTLSVGCVFPKAVLAF